MTRREPTQERARKRVELILQAAGDELATVGGADKLSTTAIAERAGISVSSVYRYFDDRWEIIGALVDREIEQLNARLVADLAGAESVNLQTLLEFFFRRHFDFFRENDQAGLIWFGSRRSEIVLDRVHRHYLAMGDWFLVAASATGFVENHPQWTGEGMIWMADRVFEVIFMEDRSDAEQFEILERGIEMIGRQMNRDFATKEGVDGISGDEFMKRIGEYLAEHPEALHR